MNDARHDDAATSRTVLRREDGRFVTGRGRYTDDINIPGQAYVTFVRSDHAHGELLSIDMAEAPFQMPNKAALSPWGIFWAGPAHAVPKFVTGENRNVF